MNITNEISERLFKLEEKYSAMGQDINAYLDGLIYADYLTYWDYIHLDTLLSLQKPKTTFPDEEIFIMYHQITELYFKLCLHECRQISTQQNLDAAFFTQRIKRINAYFTALVSSFDIMVDGMEKAQFLKFRTALLPASGFQSAQYRMIELFATSLIQLVDKDQRVKLQGQPIDNQYNSIYWMSGASELSSGKQTLTLMQFVQKYGAQLLELAKSNQQINFLQLFEKLSAEGSDLAPLVSELRKMDLLINVEWPLSHYKSAVRYLQCDPVDIAATGGTNWQKYLPPRFQKRIFFPSLWTSEETDEWGKTWVKNIFKEYHL